MLPIAIIWNKKTKRIQMINEVNLLLYSLYHLFVENMFLILKNNLFFKGKTKNH